YREISGRDAEKILRRRIAALSALLGHGQSPAHAIISSDVLHAGRMARSAARFFPHADCSRSAVFHRAARTPSCTGALGFTFDRRRVPADRPTIAVVSTSMDVARLSGERIAGGGCGAFPFVVRRSF